MSDRVTQVGGRQLKLSNLDKVLYPRTGFTKAEVIDYYARIAPVMLRHLAGRPVTLKRYPDGVEGGFFFQKNCPPHRPDWLDTVQLETPGGRRETIRFCELNDVAALVWAANLAAIELHVSMHEGRRPDRPTMMVLDLDPGEPAGFGQCVEVAFELRQILDGWQMQAYPKTSGGKGLHIYVPMHEPTDYDHTKDLARSLAQTLARRHPERVTSQMTKAGRRGKVFVDWSQNTRSKTTVCAYSLRAQPEPSVSTPVTWEELEPWLKNPKRATPRYTPAQVLDRVAHDGDLAAGLLEGQAARR